MTNSEYLRQLEANIVQLIRERDAALERVRALERETEKLKRRLRMYENPHTPPSMQIIIKKPKTDNVSKKRGAPKGHNGATRQWPEPSEEVNVSTNRCDECGYSPLGEPIKRETKVVAELPPPRKMKFTRFTQEIYICPKCGAVVKAKHPDCPQKGDLGPYLLVYITMLKFHLRGVIRRIQDWLLQNNSFELSPMGINNALLRVGDACASEYNVLAQRIRTTSKWTHVDETSMKVNGKLWWLWIFRTDNDDVLVVIRKSRGGNVPREILGEDYDRPIIVDGWSAYSSFDIVQRCWSHLLREADDFSEVSPAGKRLADEIHARFDKLKAFLKTEPPPEERAKRKEEWDKAMEALVAGYSRFKELHKPVTYLRGGLGKWHTCVLYPGMEPTNNLGEQAMREHVIIRKIIGTFRSENGSQNYQYIASLLATWKLKGKNLFEELEALLRRELCLK